MGRGRISGLDGVRGLAACGVAFFVHFFHVGGVRQDGPLFEAFGWVYTRGETLVDLFFVLSGFVICHACSHVDLRAFATQRFARLYPLHLATLAAAAALLVFGRSLTGPLALDYDADFGRALLQLSLTHAWVIADNRFGFNAPSWSISVEAACYVLFALTIRSRFALGLSAILVLVGISGIFTPWLSRGLVGFFMGVIVCRELPRLSRLPTWTLCVGAAVGVALMSLPPAPTRAAFLVAGIWAWPLVILLALRAPVSRWLDNPVLRWLGDRSYGIYMIHTPAQIAMLLANGGAFYGHDTWPLMFCVNIAVTLALADLSYRFLETPARSAIRRLGARNSASDGGASAASRRWRRSPGS